MRQEKEKEIEKQKNIFDFMELFQKTGVLINK